MGSTPAHLCSRHCVYCRVVRREPIPADVLVGARRRADHATGAQRLVMERLLQLPRTSQRIVHDLIEELAAVALSASASCRPPVPPPPSLRLCPGPTPGASPSGDDTPE